MAKGENCSKTKCKGKIKKIVIANRASFFIIIQNNKVDRIKCLYNLKMPNTKSAIRRVRG